MAAVFLSAYNVKQSIRMKAISLSNASGPALNVRTAISAKSLTLISKVLLCVAVAAAFACVLAVALDDIRTAAIAGISAMAAVYTSDRIGDSLRSTSAKKGGEL